MICQIPKTTKFHQRSTIMAISLSVSICSQNVPAAKGTLFIICSAFISNKNSFYKLVHTTTDTLFMNFVVCDAVPICSVPVASKCCRIRTQKMNINHHWWIAEDFLAFFLWLGDRLQAIDCFVIIRAHIGWETQIDGRRFSKFLTQQLLNGFNANPGEIIVLVMNKKKRRYPVKSWW